MDSRQVLLMVLLWTAGGCAAGGKALQVDMKPLELASARTTQSKKLDRDHFKRDHAGSISEQDLHRVLEAPVFLEKAARVGVVPVATCYQPDPDLPLAVVPQTLSRSMEDAGLFEVTTEVSTDWPADRGVSGLRELAARYRAEYLLLYRHRFVDRVYTNAWGWMYLTVVAVPFVPARTLETAGVLEASLFEVKTGTLLFTVFERVQAESDETLWYNDRKRRDLKSRLLAEAATALAGRVVDKTRRLAAARPRKEATEQLAAGRTP